MFTRGAKAMAEKLGLKMGRANLDEFAATLEELARANPHIVAVTSDSRGSGKLAPFGKALPGQIVEVGIAEQNLVGSLLVLPRAQEGLRLAGLLPTARSLSRSRTMSVTRMSPQCCWHQPGVATALLARRIILCTTSRSCARSTI
jgi:transketolase